jgi:uncharacterized protein YcgI (DUF1989 family)
VIKLAGGEAIAISLARGQSVRVINTHGCQVVDTWSISIADPSEYLSVEHTRRMLGRLFPKEGDQLFSNRRNALLSIDRDTSDCHHDMLLACCDSWLYKHYGCADGHANCRDNFTAALMVHGIRVPHVPNPVNFWMNVPIKDNENIELMEPASKPGDFLTLRALVEAYVVFSACPMDVTPVNGADRTPRPVHFEIFGSDQSQTD